MLRSPEFIAGQDPQASISFDAVTQELQPVLLRATHPIGNKFSELHELTLNPVKLDITRTVAMARSNLEQQGSGEAASCKESFLDSISSNYPEAHDHSSQIESPKQYLKRKKLDNSRNLGLKLKEARLKTTTKAREELLRTLRQDKEHESLITPSDEGLQDTILKNINDIQDGIKELTETLVYELKQTRLRRAARIMISSVQKRASFKSTSAEEVHRLQTTFSNLTALIQSAQQGEPAFAAIAVNHHAGDYTQNIRVRLSRHYNGIVTESVNNLTDDLNTAYGVAHSQSLLEEDEPDFSESITPEKIIEGGVQKTRRSITQEQTPSDQPKATVIETVEHAFPWHKDGRVELELIEHKENSILFCRALTPYAEDISQNLRNQNANSKKLSAMVDKIKEIELTTNSLKHPLIKAVSRMTFMGQNIRYFSNHGNNGNRAYYIVTKPTKFKKIKNLVRKHKISQETPLVILLAETDKKHQPKTLKDFRESYRYARK